MAEVHSIRENYWGIEGSPPPRNHLRGEKNKNLFEKAKYNSDKDQFQFDISVHQLSINETNYVCENAFLKLCGICTRDNKSEYPDLWKVD